jgi:hypothetical protein
MKLLFNELLTRFPEIIGKVQEGDEEMPYLTMGYLVEWLDEVGKSGLDPATIQRAADFSQWCELQPRGETASDDIWTIYVVAFLENLFLHEHTKCVIPHVTTKSDLQTNRQYFVSWVGEENYNKALEQF